MHHNKAVSSVGQQKASPELLVQVMVLLLVLQRRDASAMYRFSEAGPLETPESRDATMSLLDVAIGVMGVRDLWFELSLARCPVIRGRGSRRGGRGCRSRRSRCAARSRRGRAARASAWSMSATTWPDGSPRGDPAACTTSARRSVIGARDEVGEHNVVDGEWLEPWHGDGHAVGPAGDLVGRAGVA